MLGLAVEEEEEEEEAEDDEEVEADAENPCAGAMAILVGGLNTCCCFTGVGAAYSGIDATCIGSPSPLRRRS